MGRVRPFRIRLLKTVRRVTRKRRGGRVKTYVHFTITTSIPRRWMTPITDPPPVLVAITPFSKTSRDEAEFKRLKKLVRIESFEKWEEKKELEDAEMREEIEEVARLIGLELDEEAERLARKYMEEACAEGYEMVCLPKGLLAKLVKYGDTVEEALEKLISLAEK